MAPPPSQPRRILIIRPSALGDVCRTVPVLATLRRAWPAATIDWLVQDSFADAIVYHPDLSNVIPFPRRRFDDFWKPGVAVQIARWLRSLNKAGYDMVLDCQGLARSGVFTLATGARRRIGYAQAAEAGWLGVNERIGAPRTLHTVDRMLMLAEAAIAGVPGAQVVRDMRLYAPPANMEKVEADPLLADPYAVIAPTSRWPAKRWPAERFAQLAPRLLEGEDALPCAVSPGSDAPPRHNPARIVLVGAAGERDQCAPLLELAQRDDRIVDRIGATTVGGLMALIARSSLVIANDSAALHMAVGFDRPLVALYGPTRVDLVGPYQRQASVIQHLRPGDTLDHKHPTAGLELMKRITVDEVLTKACEAVEASRTVIPDCPR